MARSQNTPFAALQMSPPTAMPLMWRRLPHRSFLLSALGVLCLFLWLGHRFAEEGGRGLRHGNKHENTSPSSAPPTTPPTVGNLKCRELPGAEDVLVILKTGSTELQDKLPVHISTTLRCYPHYVIFSDYQETYLGETILDALESVDPNVKATHPDFELYRRLQEGGRAALKPSERSGPVSRDQGASGKPSNPGWKLDKWKFMPMVNRTFHDYPDKKWYLFAETDTYILWQTLLNYLAVLDYTRPYYIGAQTWIGDIVFAHGGTGYLVSRPALENVVNLFASHKKEWEDYTAGHWAGDCVLGKALADSGAPLMFGWPMFQGDDIGKMYYDRTYNEHRLWCTATISYHHLSPYVVKELWDFEQEWIAGTGEDTTKHLLHKDMFAQYVLPRISKSKIDWDNHSDNDEGPATSLEECGAICEAAEACVQYALSTELRCLTTSRPNLGEMSRGVESGWIFERMRKYYDSAEECHGETWIT